MLSVMVLTKLNIIITLLGITKLTKKLTFQDLRQRRVNYVLIHSNTPTVMVTIKPIWPVVPSGSTDSTEIGTNKNNKNFVKVEVS